MFFIANLVCNRVIRYHKTSAVCAVLMRAVALNLN